eukprot:1088612-Rhodomonas_salina.2
MEVGSSANYVDTSSLSEVFNGNPGILSKDRSIPTAASRLLSTQPPLAPLGVLAPKFVPGIS